MKQITQNYLVCSSGTHSVGLLCIFAFLTLNQRQSRQKLYSSSITSMTQVPQVKKKLRCSFHATLSWSIKSYPYLYAYNLTKMPKSYFKTLQIFLHVYIGQNTENISKTNRKRKKKKKKQVTYTSFILLTFSLTKTGKTRMHRLSLSRLIFDMEKTLKGESKLLKNKTKTETTKHCLQVFNTHFYMVSSIQNTSQ